MKQATATSIIALIFVFSSTAFVVKPTYGPQQIHQQAQQHQNVQLNMGFGLGDGDGPPQLTRENEPEDYFQTDLDKKTDEEKLPIALIGLAGVSLPFLLGLAALYASQ